MILFLNFAPLSFGGGAERWALDVAQSLKGKEDTALLEVSRSISDVYSKLVLKRPFTARLLNHSLKKFNITQITFKSLIPLSEEWKRIKKQINNARKIYTKFEINELLLLYYFGGWNIPKKTILGTHSPLVYLHSDQSFFEKLHNLVYLSKPMGALLRKFHVIHVLTHEQEKLLTDTFSLKNLVQIPNYISSDITPKVKKPSSNLRVGFIGELSWRKGVDILVETIERSPQTYSFFIAGDGPDKHLIKNIKRNNVHYLGYKTNKEIHKLMEEMEVVMLPSRAESFSLASLEAMSKGAIVLSSSFSTPNAIKELVMVSAHNTASEYCTLLEEVYKMKRLNKLHRKSVLLKKTIHQRFSKEKIINTLQSKLFN